MRVMRDGWGLILMGLLLGSSPAVAAESKPALPETDGSAAAITDQPDLAFGAYQRGYYVTALREALKRLETNRSDVAAMTLLGEIFTEGVGVRQDKVEAARWFELAGKLGGREAQFALGMAYLRGDGVPKDRALAIEWLSEAGAQNHSGALYNLGIMSLEGVGDFAKAEAFFRRAADVGDADAAYSLAASNPIAEKRPIGSNRPPTATMSQPWSNMGLLCSTATVSTRMRAARRNCS
jgi:uncharacterized protein